MLRRRLCFIGLINYTIDTALLIFLLFFRASPPSRANKRFSFLVFVPRPFRRKRYRFARFGQEVLHCWRSSAGSVGLASCKYGTSLCSAALAVSTKEKKKEKATRFSTCRLLFYISSARTRLHAVVSGVQLGWAAIYSLEP